MDCTTDLAINGCRITGLLSRILTVGKQGIREYDPYVVPAYCIPLFPTNPQ